MNVQTHVVLVMAPNKKVWAIGTKSKNGFTNEGARKAVQKLKSFLPPGFSVWAIELQSAEDLLASSL